MQQRNRYFLAFSAVIFILAACIRFFEGGVSEAIITDLVAIGAAIFAVAIAKEFFYRKDEPATDERTKKISWAASSYSWWLSYVLIAILILVDQFKLAALSVQFVLGGVFFFMIFSQLVLKAYFGGKGDVE